MEMPLPTSPSCTRFSKYHDLRFNDWNISFAFQARRQLYFVSTDLVSFSLCGLQDLASLPSISAPPNPPRVHSPYLYPALGRRHGCRMGNAPRGWLCSKSQNLRSEKIYFWYLNNMFKRINFGDWLQLWAVAMPAVCDSLGQWERRSLLMTTWQWVSSCGHTSLEVKPLKMPQSIFVKMLRNIYELKGTFQLILQCHQHMVLF